MLRGWRLRARWPAPIHPQLAAHLRAGVSCSCCKFCAIFPEGSEKLARCPGGARRAGSEGERGRGEARKAWVGSGSDRLERATRRRPGRGFGGVAQSDPQGCRLRRRARPQPGALHASHGAFLFRKPLAEAMELQPGPLFTRGLCEGWPLELALIKWPRALRAR